MDEQILYNNLKIIYDFYIKTKNENFIRIEYIYIDDYDYFYKQSVCNENFYNGYVRHLLQIIKNCNLQYNTIYRYVKAPKDKVNIELQAQKERAKKNNIEEEAFGTYASQGGEKIVYRVKKSGHGGYGGYKVVVVL
jgi:hypothetical protein